jgi:class 3 adenylate cyclase
MGGLLELATNQSTERASVWLLCEFYVEASMDAELSPGQYTGEILLADISGFSVFLEDVKLAHASDAFADGQIPYAYELLSGLLGGIVEKVVPPFTFVKFEGDAVFAVADGGAAPKGPDLVACIAGCYDEFASRMDEAALTWTCTCNACVVIDVLDLKFVLHSGSYIVQAIGTHVEVLGPDVTVAHRLMKNAAAINVGSPAYLLITEAAEEALDLQVGDGFRFTEQIDGSADVDTVAIALGT